MSQNLRKRLDQLLAVTETGMNAALVDIRKAINARETIDTRIAELDQARRDVLYDPLSSATLSGAQQRWLVWADQERARLNAALARARVSEARARAAAAKGFGRHQAMQNVADKRLGR